MLYDNIKSNLNRIDFELKELYDQVNISEKVTQNKFYFQILAKGNFEGLFESNDNREVKTIVLIEKNNLNFETVNWKYFVNPENTNSDFIERVSKIEELAKDIHSTVTKKQMDINYLRNTKVVFEEFSYDDSKQLSALHKSNLSKTTDFFKQNKDTLFSYYNFVFTNIGRKHLIDNFVAKWKQLEDNVKKEYKTLIFLEFVNSIKNNSELSRPDLKLSIKNASSNWRKKNSGLSKIVDEFENQIGFSFGNTTKNENFQETFSENTLEEQILSIIESFDVEIENIETENRNGIKNLKILHCGIKVSDKFKLESKLNKLDNINFVSYIDDTIKVSYID